MTMRVGWIGMAAFLMAGTAFYLGTGCDTESGNDVYRNVPINVSGVYRNSSSNGVLVSANSGGAVTSLDLRQTGDELEGVDNYGAIYRGSIGQVFAGTPPSCSFVLEGESSAGVAVTMSGTISVSSGVGSMGGRWIEDGLIGTLSGTAAGPSYNTNVVVNTGTNSLSI